MNTQTTYRKLSTALEMKKIKQPREFTTGDYKSFFNHINTTVKTKICNCFGFKPNYVPSDLTIIDEFFRSCYEEENERYFHNCDVEEQKGFYFQDYDERKMLKKIPFEEIDILLAAILINNFRAQLFFSVEVYKVNNTVAGLNHKTIRQTIIELKLRGITEPFNIFGTSRALYERISTDYHYKGRSDMTDLTIFSLSGFYEEFLLLVHERKNTDVLNKFLKWVETKNFIHQHNS